MKLLTLKNIGSCLVLISAAGTYGVANAHSNEKHEALAASSNKEQAQTSVPATAVEIWMKIDAAVAGLDKTVADGALGDVHHHAFAVRDLVASLPERSKSLPADKLAKVRSNVKFVATLAKRLDTAGDANDKVATQSAVAQLKKVLAGMRANY